MSPANRIGKWLKAASEALTVPVLATALGLLVGTLFILLAGKNPLEAYAAFAQAVAGEPRMFGETLVSSIPLVFTGLAVMLAFRCGLFNIGVEGQYLLAQVFAAWAGFALVLPGWLHPVVAMLAGMVAGALWASIVGLLKAYRGVHEVISSIMLNYTGLYLSHYLLLYYLRDPGGAFGAATPAIRPTAALTQGLIAGSRLHTGLWVALLAAFLVWVFLWKTPAGYEVRAVGLAPGAAEYGGISVAKNIVLAMALSGALTGLAGAVQTLGLNGKFYEPGGFVGYGFDGIAVALVGRNHPVGVVLAALLFGALERGGPIMQAVAGVPRAVIWVVQGTVIFFVAVEGLWRFLQRRRAAQEVKAA
ncbi:MAG TPA: ABC transporter permease [Symbiobacteriaceae bacterium]|jgi:simple sugar transport system permease protein